MAKTDKKTELTTLFERRTSAAHTESDRIYYTIPHAIKTEEVVDMDAFIPINEALKKLDGKRELTGDEVKQYYDFASGADSREEIPFNRSTDYKDIAELSEHIQNTQNNIAKEITEKQQEATWRAEISSKNAQNGATGD